MKQAKEHRASNSIRRKVMLWVIAILLVVGISVSVAIMALEVMIRDYEALSIDNNKCYAVQEAIDAERNVFMDLVREPTQQNRERFDKARLKTRQCIVDLPTDYTQIGEDRYARTWNLKNGYNGYVYYRDLFLAMDPEDENYATELYHITDIQDNLLEYSLRLIQETMEYGNRHYDNQKEILHRVPLVLICLCGFALAAVFSILRMLSSMVVSPILMLAEESRAIAANDFSRPDLEVKRRDEVGELIGSFNRMKHAMKDYIATREQLHQEEVVRLEMEKNLEHTRLEMLKSQVNPHFLFNTLNMISCMARLEDAQTTDHMIVSLGNLFRYNLRTKEQEVYLEQELEALDDYLYIQQMRYDSRISCKKDIRVNPFAVRIPSFTLQPIVENALTHGMKVKEEGGRILLRIWQEGENLIISIMDNGKGMSREEQSALYQKVLDSEKTGKSIGLGNIYRRMAVLYPEGHLRIYSKENRGTVVQLVIPQKPEREEAKA